MSEAGNWSLFASETWMDEKRRLKEGSTKRGHLNPLKQTQ